MIEERICLFFMNTYKDTIKRQKSQTHTFQDFWRLLHKKKKSTQACIFYCYCTTYYRTIDVILIEVRDWCLDEVIKNHNDNKNKIKKCQKPLCTSLSWNPRQPPFSWQELAINSVHNVDIENIFLLTNYWAFYSLVRAPFFGGTNTGRTLEGKGKFENLNLLRVWWIAR